MSPDAQTLLMPDSPGGDHPKQTIICISVGIFDRLKLSHPIKLEHPARFAVDKPVLQLPHAAARVCIAVGCAVNGKTTTQRAFKHGKRVVSHVALSVPVRGGRNISLSDWRRLAAYAASEPYDPLPADVT